MAFITRLEWGPSNLSTRLREALAYSKVVHVAGVPPEVEHAELYAAVASELGDMKPVPASDIRSGETYDETWLEVRYDPGIKDSYRHSDSGQPLHTDGCYSSDVGRRNALLRFLGPYRLPEVR